jgi:hypothetical protein
LLRNVGIYKNETFEILGLSVNRQFMTAELDTTEGRAFVNIGKRRGHGRRRHQPEEWAVPAGIELSDSDELDPAPPPPEVALSLSLSLGFCKATATGMGAVSWWSW